MARALMGHVGTVQDRELAFEVARLRRRVAELQAEVDELRATRRGGIAETVDGVDIAETVDGVDIDLELHRITATSTPALA